MQTLNREARILALDLRSRSFGFAVFEGPNHLLDWGVKSFRQGVNAVKIPASKKVSELFDDLSPCAMILKKGLTGSERRVDMRRAITKQAQKRRISIRLLSGQQVKNAFPGNAQNKYTIACVVAEY